jgi:hypothetical protein
MEANSRQPTTSSTDAPGRCREHGPLEVLVYDGDAQMHTVPTAAQELMIRRS